ncbi:MAG TPA: hypothetical protein ENK14_09645 [Caldithrix sp.]|nr:hypothetical protein [Caldithrix sp.]
MAETLAGQNFYRQPFARTFSIVAVDSVIGKFDQAVPLFREVFAKDQNWRTVTLRLRPNGLLKVTPAQFDKIMNLK